MRGSAPTPTCCSDGLLTCFVQFVYGGHRQTLHEWKIYLQTLWWPRWTTPYLNSQTSSRSGLAPFELAFVCLIGNLYFSGTNGFLHIWLVVSTILKILCSQWEGLSHILWKKYIKHVPNNQPDFYTWFKRILRSSNTLRPSLRRPCEGRPSCSSEWIPWVHWGDLYQQKTYHGGTAVYGMNRYYVLISIIYQYMVCI